MQPLFYAHSGLRYLVLLAGVLALVYFAYAATSRGGNPRAGKILGSAFVGLVDLQSLLGLIMVAMGLYYPALLGHLFMMILAAVCAHVAMAMAKSSTDQLRAARLRLAGVVLALILIVAGIMAIGRSVFGSGAPSVS